MIEAESRKFSDDFVVMPIENILRPETKRPTALLRNRHFVAQIYITAESTRISINRAKLKELRDGKPIWADNITWDEIQEIKGRLGYGDCDAVEIYPKDQDVVNVANMRHIWILSDDHPLDFIWRLK